MKLNICNYCRKDYFESDTEGYCSVECEMKSRKANYTTISIRQEVRNRIILLQNKVLELASKKVPYSDLIDHIFNIVEQRCGKDRLPDIIINDYKYYL